MNDETRHVNPFAPRSLSDKPFVQSADFTFKRIGERDPDALTNEEAQWLIDLIEKTPMKYPPELTSIYKKLRRISEAR